MLYLSSLIICKDAVTQISLKYFSSAKIVSTATICHKCLELVNSASKTYSFTQCEENNNNQFFKFSKVYNNNFLYNINSITNKEAILHGSSKLDNDLLVFFVSEDGDAVISQINENKCLTKSTNVNDIYSFFSSCDLANNVYTTNQVFKIYNKDYVQQMFYVEGTLIDENNNNSIINNLSSFLKNLYIFDINKPNSYINLRLHETTGKNSYFSAYLPRGTYDYNLDPFVCIYYKSLTAITYKIDTCYENLSEYKLNFRVSKFSDKLPPISFEYIDGKSDYLAKDEILSIQFHNKKELYKWIELDETTFDPSGLYVDSKYYLAQPAKEEVLDYPINCLYHTYTFKVYYSSIASSRTEVYESNNFLPADSGVTSHSEAIYGREEPLDIKDIPIYSCSNSLNYLALYAQEENGKLTFYNRHKCNELVETNTRTSYSYYTTGGCRRNEPLFGYNKYGYPQCTLDCLIASQSICPDGYVMNYFNISSGLYIEAF